MNNDQYNSIFFAVLLKKVIEDKQCHKGNQLSKHSIWIRCFNVRLRDNVDVTELRKYFSIMPTGNPLHSGTSM